jgi:hypothetical protein
MSSFRLTCKGTLRQVFIYLGPESGQIQSVKLLQNMVSNKPQHPHTLQDTHCLYILYCDTGKGEGVGKVEPERRLEGQQFTKLG